MPTQPQQIFSEASTEKVLPFVTIIVPMRNEADWIAPCLQSLCAQDYPWERMEILVLDGRSTDDSCSIVRAIVLDDERIHLLDNPGLTQAHAMNIGIHAAQGDIVIRADAHALYGKNYVSISVEHLCAGKADNVGGLQRPVAKTPIGRAIAIGTSTWLGSGGAAYRVAKEPCYTDTVWLGAWFKKTLLDLGGFNTDLPLNEDYECNIRLRKQGGRILLDPALESQYYPRESIRALWRQYFRYGTGKVETLWLHSDSLRVRQLIPPLFIALLVITLALLPISPVPFQVLGFSYLAVIAAGSLYTGMARSFVLFPLYPIIYMTIHLAWGLGFWWRLLVPRRKAV